MKPKIPSPRDKSWQRIKNIFLLNPLAAFIRWKNLFLSLGNGKEEIL
jgi:hypothetical protein